MERRDERVRMLESEKRRKINKQRLQQISEYEERLKSLELDMKSFVVVGYMAHRGYLVLKLLYSHPDGTHNEACTFNGTKILVFENAGLQQAIFWNKIDPHFREASDAKVPLSEAPPPIARFPGDDKGWNNAKIFVEALTGESM